MRLVHNSAGAQVAPRLALAVLLLFAGCSDDDGSGPASVAGAGLGAPIRTADCTDWKKASPRQRRQSIEEIRQFAGGPVNQGSGRTLDDDRAYRLFDRTCSRYYARGFKLYKLYTRAAAFDLQRR